MNRNLIEDTEGSGFLSGFLDLARGGADIYRTVTQPDPAAPPTSPTQRVVQTPVGSFSPLAIGGAVIALVLVLWLALRGK